METMIPRVVMAGTNSGCGKTTVTCAVLQALADRDIRAGAFKCGPDYIDPMFHRRIIGADSTNLDSFFFRENTLKYLLSKYGAGRSVSVIEGVMGFYDGLGLTSAAGSTYDVARITESPVVLVVGARGGSLSILAVIQGFLDFVPDSNIRGVILNQCTESTYTALSEEITKRFGGTVAPLGFMPPMPECSLESRHLGLVTAEEVADLREKLHVLAEQAEKSIDIDGLLDLARTAPPVRCEDIRTAVMDEPVRIAVARDRAFCFYYEDSLDLLREMGAELVPFSPLNDTALPADIDGIYLGGGYPELYAERLSSNTGMRASVREALARGVPCIAECGGFMYLTETIDVLPMAGALPGGTFGTGRLRRFGYITLTANGDSMLCGKGEKIKAHEFHHWDSEYTGDGFTAEKANGRSWECIHAGPSLYAGYPHFNFYSNPVFAENFYKACLKEKHRNDREH